MRRRDDGARLLPAAQFTATGIVPHTSGLRPAVPTELAPGTFYRSLAVSQPDPQRDAQPVPLVDRVTAGTGAAGMIVQAMVIAREAEWSAV